MHVFIFIFFICIASKCRICPFLSNVALDYILSNVYNLLLTYSTICGYSKNYYLRLENYIIDANKFMEH